MRRNVTEKNVRDRALKDCKKAGVGPLRPCMSGRDSSYSELLANHRASECALQAPRKAIALPDDFQESVE